MQRTSGLDRSAVQRGFAQQQAADDFLYREVERRLLERLDPIRLAPVERILDLGCGSGASAAPLQARYPQAGWLGLDFNEHGLRQAAREADRQRGRFWQRWRTPSTGERLRVAADAHALPLAPACVDLLWSNLVAHWLDDPLQAVAEWRRVLRPEGLVLFCTFGPDSFREWRAGGGDLPQWQDMHDWGDALVQAGFRDPVMDSEHLTLTYREAAAWSRDLAVLLPDRPFPGGAGLEQDVWGSVTIELVFGHAWVPAPRRLPEGYVAMNFVSKLPRSGG